MNPLPRQNWPLIRLLLLPMIIADDYYFAQPSIAYSSEKTGEYSRALTPRFSALNLDPVNDSTQHDQLDDATARSIPDGPFSRRVILAIALGGSICLVWLCFDWVTTPSAEPSELIEDLRTLDRSTWPNAYALSNKLARDKDDRIKQDAATAAQLASVLRAHLAADSGDPQRIQLCVFLCRALGEFKTAEALPALTSAASTRRRDAEIDIQRAAIEAFAVLAHNLGPEVLRENDLAMAATLDAAESHGETNERDAQLKPLRSTAAFALGVIGGPTALEKLKRMLIDADSNTRYNAATGLARHGKAEAIPVLIEMLDTHCSASLSSDEPEDAVRWRRQLVITNAIQATRQLAAANPGADISTLNTALEQLQSSDVPTSVSMEARDAVLSMKAARADAQSGYAD